MTTKEFEKLKTRLKDFEFDKDSIKYNNISFNIGVDRYCIDNDFARLINDLLFDGNERKSIKEFEYNIFVLLEENAFSDEEWSRIIPELDCYAFWKDVKQLDKKVLPLFNQILDYKKDISLEFWQGALSGKEKKPFWANDAGINAWRNGEDYCRIIKQIQPYIDCFEEKYPCSISTLRERYS